MLLRLDWQSESRVMAVFDTYIAVLDPAPAPRPRGMIFGGATLQSAAPGRRQTALLLNVRGGNSLVTLDENLAAMAEIPARQAFGVSATDTDIYLLCPDAVECFGYDGVQKWVQRPRCPPSGRAGRRPDAGVYREQGQRAGRHRTKSLPLGGSHSHPKNIYTERSTHLCHFPAILYDILFLIVVFLRRGQKLAEGIPLPGWLS